MSDTLVLVGMLDSPFVRRVAIALQRAAIPYENLPLRTFDHAERFARYSPLKRAPTLVLESGEALFDSHLILAYLAERHPEVAALLPADSAKRLRCFQAMGVATGLADKAVSGVYEKVFHAPEHRHPVLMQRLAAQLTDALAWLEERAPEAGWLVGDTLSHADIAVGAAICFTREAHPDLVAMHAYPRVAAWCARLDALEAFQATYLPLDPPTPSA
jgi:glutathione S-transferase